MKAGKDEKKKQQYKQTNSKKKKKANTNKSNQEGKSEWNQKSKQVQSNDGKKKVTGKQIKYCDIYTELCGETEERQREGHLNPDAFSKRRLAPGHFKQLLYC